MKKETDHIKVWTRCLEIIKDIVPLQSFKTWFEPIQPVKLKEATLTIQVPSQFFYEYLEEHYITLLKKAIKKELGPKGQLEYSIIMEDSMSRKKPYTIKIPAMDQRSFYNRPVSLPPELCKETIRNPFIIPGLQKVHIDPQLNPVYSFDNFIEGDCNRLARSAGYAISNNPGKTSFNPLLIYGGGGLGKTHLAHAIGIEIKKKFPDKIVLYVSADKFQTQFVDAIKNNCKNDFVHFYQMIDILIIDDIQYFAGKEKTQDVFFHIFNHLHQTGKQFILTADKPPIEMQGIEQRLLSRFKWGLSADLQPPDFETRMAILKKKIQTDGLEMPKDVVEYLAYSISSNIRELHGALITLLAQSSFNKKPITLELAKEMINKFVKNTTREVSIDYIQKVVCDYFELPIELLKSKTRKRDVVQARQLAMYFAKNMTKSSLAKIGSYCGGKDHATVLHACRTVNDLMETNKKFKQDVSEIEKRIGIE